MNTPKLILAECRNWFEDVQDGEYDRPFIHLVRVSYI